MKRKLSLLLAVVMILGSFSFAFAADVNPVEFLEENDILKGDISGDLMLDEPLLRRDAVVLLSRLLGVAEEAEAFEEEGLPTFNDLTDNKYYRSVIAWAESNGYYTGNPDGSFGYLKNQTAKEYAIVLLRALGYGNDDKKVEWDNAWELAKELDLLANVEAEANDEIARRVIAQMTYNALGTTLKDSEETLAEKLGIDMPVPEVVEATKVESVYAENLKEVVVVFDGEVDVTSAEEVNNYSTTAGAIGSAALSEDLTTVTLTLDNGVAMTNQKEYTLTVSGVKAGNAKISASKVKFAPIDNKLPEVVEVKSLGTKALKVVASEPIKVANNSMFKLDGKSFFGTVKAEGREVVLKPYNSTSVLTPGEHKLTVAKLEDYYGLKSLEEEIAFVVVEDKEAPQVVEVTATLEKATIEFNEDIDPDTVSRTGFYWLSGTVKKYAKSFVVSGNKIVLDFSDNPLPAYETTLYINGVGDYSGNKVADLEVKVAATVDQTRPEVIDVKVSTDAKTITVKFNKIVSGTKKANYVIKNEEGKVVSVKDVTPATTDANEYKVNLYSALPAGINTITISGIADVTALKNVMLPYTTDLVVGDKVAPKADDFVTTAYGRQIIITFDKAMDLASIADPNKYLVEVTEDGVKSWVRLPEGTEINPLNDGKAVRIVLPEYLKDEVKYEVGTNVHQIQLMGLVDTADNMMTPYIKVLGLNPAKADVAKYDNNAGDTEYAALTDGKTIKIKFNQAIGEVKNSDIKVISDGVNIVSSVVENETSVVTVNLSKSIGTDLSKLTEVEIVADNAIKTVTGNGVVGKKLTAVNIADRVKPEVNVAEGTTDISAVENRIELPFTEELGGRKELYAFDLVVTRLADNRVLTADTHYSTTFATVEGKDNTKVIVIELTESGLGKVDSRFTVKVKEGAEFIVDKAGNKVAESEVYETNSLLVANYAVVAEAAKITSITAPAKDATELTLPTVGDGFTVKIKSSDKKEVIGLDGKIVPPAEETTVKLVLTVTQTSTGKTADTVEIDVIVPAKTVEP